MTDDMEPVLQRHLRARADVVRPQPDVGDLHRRITGRDRSPRRAVVAVLAVAVALGPVGGFALGRAASSDDDSSAVATGGGDSTTTLAAGGSEGASSNEGGHLGGLDYVGAPLDFLGRRTTAQGIELVVRAGGLGDPALECEPDRVVRVGVVASEALVGSVLASTYPAEIAPQGVLGLTGLAEGRPVLVGIIRASEGQVVAQFPDGTVDTATVEGGVAVVAAFAAPAPTPDGLLASTIQLIEAPAGTPSTIGGASGAPVCDDAVSPTTPAPPLDEKPALPDPGEPPAAPAEAEAQVRAAFTGAFDSTTSPDDKARFIERPDVWRDANQQLLDGPYGDAARDLQAEIDAVVFTDPSHASVRYQLISSDGRVPRFQIGDAVLVKGTWLVAITTPCDLLTLAGVHCNMGR